MADWKSIELFTDIASANVQTAFDDYQFVWVDGRANNVARRVIIDSQGEIVPGTIGVQKPAQKAEVSGVRFSDRNDEGTGISRGKILLVRYTYVNDHEEESNPSPVLVIDGIQFQAKGFYTKDGINYLYPVEGAEYTFDQNRVGSIESFVLSIPIDHEKVRRVNIYVAEADYAETTAPVSAMRLITTKQVPSGSPSIVAVISAIPSIYSISYENDLAPKGDAITLADGTPFIGNAVNSLGLAQSADKVWAITITNQNKYNYVNRWIRLDLYDESGVAPKGADVLDGIADWDLEDTSLFRLMDSDISTPLEVFHYPIGANVKTHRVISPGDVGAVHAELTYGSEDSGFKIRAKEAGTVGNSITFAMIYGMTQGLIVCDPDPGDYIILTTALGVYHATVRIVAPGSTSSLGISCVVTDVHKHAITITLASSGATPTSTVADVIAAINAAMSGGVLDGIISGIETLTFGESFNTSYVFTGTSDIDTFVSITTVAEAADNDVTAYLKYNAATEKTNSTVSSVIMAIGNSVSASALVDAEQISLTGDGVVDLLAEANLEGGEGSGWAAPTDDIQTSMLSWIRIPHIPAHSEKTIYLIRFSSEPIDIANPFTELIKTGSPSSGQMLISEFYRDKIDHNPIADENVLIAERAHLSPDNPIPASDIYAYTTSNAANMFFRSRDANNPIASVLKRATAYDEYGSTSHILDYVYRYSVKMWTWQGNDAVCSSKNKMALTGYAWARLSPAPFQQSKRTGIAIGRPTADLKPENTPIYIRERFTGEYPYLTWQIEYMNGSGDWVQMMNLGRYTYVGAGITDLVCLAVSWEQSMIGGGLTIRVGVLVNGIYRYAEAITGTEIELDNDMALRLISSEQGDKLRTLYGLRVNETIRNEWQMLNVLRFMPLFNTEGIGAYDTFYANDNAGVSYLNSNTTITTIIGKEDTRPGRIQWGSYGAMPDLNEYSINEDIMGITPIKSFQPTDEHNTILVFTKNNTAVLALLGNSSKTCTVTRQLTGVGLVSRKGLCVLNNGVAWLSQQGIMVITSSGIVNISRGVINTSSITSLRYDHDRNWIWARTDEAQTYVYQSDEKVWWEYNESSPPDDFMGCINNQYGWISYEDRIMYKDGSDPSIGNRATLIKTRAVSMIKKLGRVKLIGNLTAGTYSLRARMFSNRITGIATETAEFTTAMNGRTAIPGVGADYVQLDLKGVNNIVAVAIEYEDGVR